MICNLHTLDTARQYCDRIVGIAAGEVLFDGAPDELTLDAVRRIYGVEDDGSGFDESATSTAAGLEQIPLHEPRREAMAA